LVAPTVIDSTIKKGTSVTLSATCGSGVPNWYSSLSSLTSLGSVTFTTPILQGTTTYYVACESGGKPNCVSNRTAQVVNVNVSGSIGSNLSAEMVDAKARLSNENTDENADVVVNVSPNPTTGLLNWKLQSKELTDVNLYLLNAVGREQMTQNIPTFAQSHEGTIDMSKFNSGAYLLKFKLGEKVITKKVIKN
jgi:Ig-like domain CHU_C associated/Secretion system C-terminal sorting domain